MLILNTITTNSKKKVELHTIAIGALVNKATLVFTNEQLAELYEKLELEQFALPNAKLQQILDLLAGQGPRP